VTARHAIVAAARVVEDRVRRSARVRRAARATVAALARRSSEVRAFVRLRLMRLV
jgi:hypothetical protein